MEHALTDDELNILLQDMLVTYGYDFTEYAKASMKRRIHRIMINDKFASFNSLRYRIQNDPAYFQNVITEISVSVTEMFRDANFYRTVRQKIIPVLATHPFIRIWHAGCATGEEVYSMAILLHEANVLHKSLLYATDINDAALDRASRGIFPASNMQLYSRNYIESGGIQDFSKYYTSNYNLAKFNDSFREKMIFSTHNLVSDFSFNSFQLIFCRNVLIYFEKNLQLKVLKLFDQSLEMFGFLALGTRETIRFSGIENKYKQFEGREKIWKKIL